MKGRPSCFLFFIDCFTFHLVAFAVLFSSFSTALLYIPIASPIRMPFGTPFPCLQTEQVGKLLMMFRDSVYILFRSQVWSMRGRRYSCPICLTLLSFVFPFSLFHRVVPHFELLSATSGAAAGEFEWNVAHKRALFSSFNDVAS